MRARARRGELHGLPPDFVRETFEPGTDTGGCDHERRGLRCLEWRWAPNDEDEVYLTDMAYLLRDESGSVQVLHDRHVMGLFSREFWIASIADAGFEPIAVPLEHTAYANTGNEVFLGLRP